MENASPPDIIIEAGHTEAPYWRDLLYDRLFCLLNKRNTLGLRAGKGIIKSHHKNSL